MDWRRGETDTWLRESSTLSARHGDWRSRGEWGDDSVEIEWAGFRKRRYDDGRHDDGRHDESHHDGDNCDDDPDDGDGGVGHPVPEPSTVLLVGAGLLGLGRRLRSRP